MSCSDISINESVLSIEGGLIVMTPFSGVVGSYILIWTTVLREPSAKKFFKVLSTCGSHLLVVSLFYGTIAEVYLFSSSAPSSDEKVFGLESRSIFSGKNEDGISFSPTNSTKSLPFFPSLLTVHGRRGSEIIS
ncbi:olfactory receptor 1500-like [Talpa occidentalis]|uniref:olfactory receptor 1500-like n=1 Tax=Talpa occidentalis TaxID=50954 RepID=UPI0023F76220|nr:olfactory receptor 1500-like [Talpa occidentalis]